MSSVGIKAQDEREREGGRIKTTVHCQAVGGSD